MLRSPHGPRYIDRRLGFSERMNRPLILARVLRIRVEAAFGTPT
jgi:hypothetical protein